MTEDPVKLYVIVMAILLCVLGYVALDSYRQSEAYEDALLRAPQEAKQMKALGSEVQALVDQLDQSELRQGERTLIDNVARRLGVVASGFDTDTPPIGRGIRGREKRFKFSFGSGRTSSPLTREQVGRFCQEVERNSRGILKTIEVNLSRTTGDGAADPGKVDVVTGETYRGWIVFGLRVVE